MSMSYKTKTDLVVNLLREMILSGEIEPGEKLLQDALAERLNVSPTPIREALRKLEAEGILAHSPHKGVRVAEAKLQNVWEIYQIRGALEEVATRVAVTRLNREEIERLRLLQEDMDRHISNGELKGLRKVNQEFHMRLYRIADMPRLLAMISSLWTQFPWDTLHVLPGRAARSAEEHRHILKAIEDGDAEQAGQLMRAHIESGSRTLTDFLLSKEQEASANSTTEAPG